MPGLVHTRLHTLLHTEQCHLDGFRDHKVWQWDGFTEMSPWCLP